MSELGDEVTIYYFTPKAVDTLRKMRAVNWNGSLENDIDTMRYDEFVCVLGWQPFKITIKVK